MKHSFDNVGSLFGTGFAEQGAVCLQAKQRHTWLQSVYLDTWEAGRLYKLISIRWDEKLHTLANFSPCKLLTLLPSGSCSRRSTLFPITHMGIFSSVESCIKTKKRCKIYSWFLAWSFDIFWHFQNYLNLIHPRPDIKEAAFWSNIIQEQDSMSFTEIGPGNTTESTVRRNTTLFLV